MSGNKEQRARCWDYTNWLMKQRRNNGTCSVDPSARNDCESCDVPGSIDLPRLQGNCHKVEEATGRLFSPPISKNQSRRSRQNVAHLLSRLRRNARPKNGGRFVDGRRDVFQDTEARKRRKRKHQRRQRLATPRSLPKLQMGRCTRGNQCKYSRHVHGADMAAGRRKPSGRGYNHPETTTTTEQQRRRKRRRSQIITLVEAVVGGGGNGKKSVLTTFYHRKKKER